MIIFRQRKTTQESVPIDSLSSVGHSQEGSHQDMRNGHQAITMMDSDVYHEIDDMNLMSDTNYKFQKEKSPETYKNPSSKYGIEEHRKHVRSGPPAPMFNIPRPTNSYVDKPRYSVPASHIKAGDHDVIIDEGYLNFHRLSEDWH